MLHNLQFFYRLAILATIDRPDEEMIKTGVSAYNTENFSLGNDSITFHFSASEVSYYAAGAQQATFKLRELRS